MEAIRPDGVLDVDEVIVIGHTDGSFTAEQAEAFGLAILEAVRRLDAGLPGTPGGVPAVLAQLDPPQWPPAAEPSDEGRV